MFMPAVFHENLFDDFFDPFWNDGALERAMNREERETFGKRGANMMKTDVKQTENGYDVAVDLPGCKKEDVQMELNDGYLTIQAVRNHSNDEKDEKGHYIANAAYKDVPGAQLRIGNLPRTESTGVHSIDDLVVGARGPHADAFRGFMNSTEVFRIMSEALALGNK